MAAHREAPTEHDHCDLGRRRQACPLQATRVKEGDGSDRERRGDELYWAGSTRTGEIMIEQRRVLRRECEGDDGEQCGQKLHHDRSASKIVRELALRVAR